MTGVRLVEVHQSQASWLD